MAGPGRRDVGETSLLGDRVPATGDGEVLEALGEVVPPVRAAPPEVGKTVAVAA